MILTYDFLEIPTISEDLINSFDNMPNDTYLKQKYCFRKRRYSKYKVEKGLKVTLMEGNIFSQDERFNKYLGNVVRSYEPVHKTCESFVKEYLEKNSEIMTEIIKGESTEIGIHQIRITTFNNNEGLPVPEGYHQDGFDYILLIPIQQYGYSGGFHSIRYGSQDGPEILSKQIPNGQSIILNDKYVYHYASPIFAKYCDTEGYRDTIVVTIG